MNQHPVQLLEPIFRGLDTLIAGHGHLLYMGLVYVSLPLIAWVLSGGLRRKSSQRPRATILSIIVIRPPVRPPPLPYSRGESPERGQWPRNDDDSSSFAA